MNRLSIGEVIFKLRKEKGITQDGLGKVIGVSTAAVSKWESGISYPDITLLPVLATFLNVSIDKLMNFKIELSDEEVLKIFRECEPLFSGGNLYKAIDTSKEYIRKYPLSYYLKLKIGYLYVMYSWKADNEEKQMKITVDAIELFEDVVQNCKQVEFVESSLFQLGALYQLVGEDDKAIESLNKIHKGELDPNTLLSSIYIKRNDFKKAREILQTNLFKSINDISFACIGLATSYMKDNDLNMVEKYYNLSINIKKTLSPEADSIIGLSMEFLNFAETYLEFNDSKKSIDMLHKMLEDIRKNDINKPIKFSSVWCFNEIPSGNREITMNLYENIFNIFEQPIYNLIRENKEFIDITNELKVLEKKSSY